MSRKLYSVLGDYDPSLLEELKRDAGNYCRYHIHSSGKVVCFKENGLGLDGIGVFVEKLVPVEQEKLAVYLRGWLEAKNIRFLYFSKEQSKRWNEQHASVSSEG